MTDGNEDPRPEPQRDAPPDPQADPRPRPTSRPLPSRPSAGNVIGGILAGLEHLVTNRPRTTTQIEERHREPWASADGLSVEGLDEPIKRDEPPDRSGARL